MSSAPVGENDVEFDMTSGESLHNERLLPNLARLRETDPVHWSELNRCWHITTYEDVAAAFQDTRFSNVRMSTYAFRSIPAVEHERVIPNLTRYIKGWIVNNDGEVHRRLRSVTTKALNKKFVDSLRPLFQSLSSELTRKAVSLRQCDFAAEILRLLGLPLQHLEKVREWNRAITRALSAVFASAESLIAADRAIEEMNNMVLAEIARRRALPGEDLLTQLITLSDDAAGTLTEDEVLGLCHILLTAGHETTVNSMVFGLNAWANNPEQVQLFLSGKVDPLAAMQEVSRHIGMSTAQPRVAAEDFEFGGKPMRKGDVVFLWILSANMDPKVFPAPERLDLTRPNIAAAMTFGPGLHHCVGHYLARVELEVFFRSFLPCFSKIEILDKPLAVLPNVAFRGLAHLNVRLTPGDTQWH
jgi:pimeloyl-[acyl-carrier protein] synthase